jgi:hypothetical protein
MLFKLVVWPSSTHSSAFLFEKLLPFLADEPISTTLSKSLSLAEGKGGMSLIKSLLFISKLFRQVVAIGCPFPGAGLPLALVWYLNTQ